MNITRADGYSLGDDVIHQLDDWALSLFFIDSLVGRVMSFDYGLHGMPGSFVEELAYTINGSVDLFDALLDSIGRCEAHSDSTGGGEGEGLLAIEVVWVRSRDVES